MTSLNTGYSHPKISPQRGSDAAREARRYRAEWLLSVTAGLITPFDVLTQAATPEGRPLLRLSLRQLLLAQPGWGRDRTMPRLNELRRMVGARDAKLTVGWLLDPRAGGRRFLTFLEIFTAAKTEPPWPGFPFAPAPVSVVGASLADWSSEGV